MEIVNQKYAAMGEELHIHRVNETENFDDQPFPPYFWSIQDDYLRSMFVRLIEKLGMADNQTGAAAYPICLPNKKDYRRYL